MILIDLQGMRIIPAKKAITEGDGFFRFRSVRGQCPKTLQGSSRLCGPIPAALRHR